MESLGVLFLIRWLLKAYLRKWYWSRNLLNSVGGSSVWRRRGPGSQMELQLKRLLGQQALCLRHSQKVNVEEVWVWRKWGQQWFEIRLKREQGQICRALEVILTNSKFRFYLTVTRSYWWGFEHRIDVIYEI